MHHHYHLLDDDDDDNKQTLLPELKLTTSNLQAYRYSFSLSLTHILTTAITTTANTHAREDKGQEKISKRREFKSKPRCSSYPVF